MARMRQSLLLVIFWSLSLFFSCSRTSSALISISAPRSTQDWQQLAALEVHVFDCPPTTTSLGGGLPQLAIWNLFQKERTIRSTYHRHVTTARKFRGTKYAVFCAKNHNNQVIGMVQLGVVVVDADAMTSHVRRPTVGVMCVDHKYRGQGVGTMLLEHCNHVVWNVWKESKLYCEVEESNEVATKFFTTHGFVPTGHIVTVKVQRNHRTVEQRPHSLLCKDLTFVPTTEDLSIEYL
jgi:ribosomal protein S18 acetylase RimI-like enzyme